MSMDIKLPELGEGIEEGAVVSIQVKPGDEVKKEQVLLEIETGKATLEVPADAAGTVGEVSVHEGDTVKVGQVIATLNAPEEEPASPPQPEPEEEPSAPDVSPEPEPATDEPPQQAAAPEPSPEPTPEAKKSETPLADHTPKAAPPAIRRLARELGADIEAVEGSGPDGLMTEDDVKAHVRNRLTSGAAPSTGTSVRLPDFSQWGPVHVESMSGIRKATANHMARCWADIPHVTQHDVADVTELEALRRKYASKAEKAGGKLTVTAIVLKITAAALKVFPRFASSLDRTQHTLIYKDYIHIGVAVDTPKGLLAPVIRDVDKKNIVELSAELADIAERAREGRITPDEMKGGVFTLTNVGGIGGSFFTPIVNAPEVAILGIGRSATQTRCARDGEPCRHESKLPLSLSYDHRVIDGADGARFIRWIVEAIEEPLLISLEG